MKNQEKIEKSLINVEANLKEIRRDRNKSEQSSTLTNKEVDGESLDVAKSDEPSHKDNKQMNVKKVRRNRKKKVSWIGTSLSKALNKEKFEEDLNVDLSVSRAYCIKVEDNAKYRNENFEEIVPKVIEKEEPDILVFQTGSIEITNIEVNKAMMDKDMSLEEHKKVWFEKVEQDSKNLFDIAQAALKKNKSIQKVVILKRLPRYDRSSSDFFSIKSELSKYANSIYDQLWIKMGSPKNMIILQLDLEGSRSYQNLIYGSPNSQKYDGIHLNGEGAERQFTYQTIKQLKLKLFGTTPTKPKPNQKSWEFDNDHSNCPQAQHQRRPAAHAN